MKTTFSRDFKNDPEWIAMQEESKRLAASAEERVRQLQAEQPPLMKELADAGVIYSSLGDMVKSPGPYKEAIPILLAHLEEPYSVPTRGNIARCLAVPDARCAWPRLVALYRSEPGNLPHADSIKSDLAVAVAATTTEANIATLAELARDRSNGSSRLLLLRRLRRSKSLFAKQALEDLVTDPDLEKEIASWSKKSRAKS